MAWPLALVSLWGALVLHSHIHVFKISSSNMKKNFFHLDRYGRMLFFLFLRIIVVLETLFILNTLPGKLILIICMSSTSAAPQSPTEISYEIK